MNNNIRSNYLRSIQKIIRKDVKDDFLNIKVHLIPMKDATNAFCEKYDLKIPSVQSKKRNEWLITLYLDKSFENLKKSDCKRNYTTTEWLKVCDNVYYLFGRNCLCCGSSKNISMDHIKPYSKFPELALDMDNLQPLCRSCNSKKGNRSQEDYRPFLLSTQALQKQLGY